MIYQWGVAAFRREERNITTLPTCSNRLLILLSSACWLIELLCDTLSAMTRADLVGTTLKGTETFVSKITATNYCSWAPRSIRASHRYVSIASVTAVPSALEEDGRCTCANLGRHVIKSRKIRFSLKSIYQPLEVICALRLLIPWIPHKSPCKARHEDIGLSQWQTWTLNIQDCRK